MGSILYLRCTCSCRKKKGHWCRTASTTHTHTHTNTHKHTHTHTLNWHHIRGASRLSKAADGWWLTALWSCQSSGVTFLCYFAWLVFFYLSFFFKASLFFLVTEIVCCRCVWSDTWQKTSALQKCRDTLSPFSLLLTLKYFCSTAYSDANMSCRNYAWL